MKRPEALPLPDPEGFHGYTEEALLAIRSIPARSVGLWEQYATGCVRQPEVYFGRTADQHEAVKLCHKDCPVVQQCGEWALGTEEEFGVRGGMTERERRAMLKGEPRLSWRRRNTSE